MHLSKEDQKAILKQKKKETEERLSRLDEMIEALEKEPAKASG